MVGTTNLTNEQTSFLEQHLPAYHSITSNPRSKDRATELRAFYTRTINEFEAKFAADAADGGPWYNLPTTQGTGPNLVAITRPEAIMNVSIPSHSV